MCADPVLLCLDEPAAGLNQSESAELNKLFPDPRPARHLDPADRARHEVVMEISDHIVVLDYGVKIADGAPVRCATTRR